MLYDVPEWDEKLLDEWEGTALGVFVKIRVRVQTLEGEVGAWLYVVDGYEGGLPQPTTSESLLTRPRKLERRMTTSRTCELVRAATSTRSHKFDGKALERGHF